MTITSIDKKKKEAEEQCKKDIVETLERLLEQARDGKIIFLAALYADTEFETGMSFSGIPGDIYYTDHMIKNEFADNYANTYIYEEDYEDLD